MSASPRYHDQSTMISRQIREANERIDNLFNTLNELATDDVSNIEREIVAIENEIGTTPDKSLTLEQARQIKLDLIDDLRMIKQNIGAIKRFGREIAQDPNSIIHLGDQLDTKCNDLLYKLEYKR